MKLLLSLTAMLAAFALPAAFAADGETTMKTEDLKDKNVTPGGDVDEMITNNKMRAETGSKSRWSLSLDMAYNGGSLEKPLAADRPNIAAASGTTDNASLNGNVSTKMNINKQHSLALGVGVRWIAPLEGKKPQSFSGDRVDADNPYLTYQYVYKWSGTQSVLQVIPTAYTASNLTRLGYVGGVTVAQNNIYEVGTTGLSLGLYTDIGAKTFSKSGSVGTAGEEGFVADVRAEQSDYTFSIDPFLEYQLTDKINLRTVANLWNYEHIRNASGNWTFFHNKVFQSVGVGIAVTRDIFIYPNVQFLPDNIRADLTNVAVNTNINIF